MNDYDLALLGAGLGPVIAGGHGHLCRMASARRSRPERRRAAVRNPGRDDVAAVQRRPSNHRDGAGVLARSRRRASNRWPRRQRSRIRFVARGCARRRRRCRRAHQQLVLHRRAPSCQQRAAIAARSCPIPLRSCRGSTSPRARTFGPSSSATTRPSPGFLTNLRSWQMVGGEVQVLVKNRRLVIRGLSMLPVLRRGVELHPVDVADPLLFAVEAEGLVVPVAFRETNPGASTVWRSVRPQTPTSTDDPHCEAPGFGGVLFSVALWPPPCSAGGGGASAHPPSEVQDRVCSCTSPASPS